MLAEIDTWVLDLDDTLYPSSNGLADQMKALIRGILSRHFGTDDAGARRIQAELIAAHGTTLRGLMTTEGLAAADILEFEHHIDYSVLRADALLAEAIAALPGRKFVFTNGSAYHAEQALARLGLSDHFDGVFDILAGQLIPKPYPESYRRFVEQFSIDPSRAAFFDDLAVNLDVPEQLGMATVWVGGEPAPGTAPYEVVAPRRWRVWELAPFLHSLTAPAVRPSTM
ncbi:putative hydrolase of the HAD superfamily [Kribbella orskensis]|uniref:Hydrolase of the HAD superfamily n=1 Tax=Kribbella orskensis TaxID=2512216 RepID=A0ABY2BFE1_9ACTN|nr:MULTISPECIES: pyrimidine 5'-nucleotidase [Kribbella]TCN37013.1 putative hydrolase of the HAD superfamily [Kribbella sp. VKM Ac-2500]TCO18438.1 putative hydrolase of the HAD superfamily [Kribbella orskensis]